MDIFRVTAFWSGFAGAPGYSSFHFAGGGGLISDAQQVADRVADAFDEIQTILPSTVRIQVQGEVEVLDSETGILQGYQQVTEPPAVSGGASTAYSAPSGAVINWRTNDLRFGRRIRGRTFLVPLAQAAYEDDGSLMGTTITRVSSMAETLAGWDFDSELGVWSRPRDGSGGVFATVTGFNVPDMAAVLRSRRD